MNDYKEKPYPDYCVRGVPNSSYIGDADGIRFAYPHSIYEGERSHSSINWVDEEKAIIDLLIETKLDGNGIEKIKYESGYIKIPENILRDLKRSSRLGGLNDFDYERDPIEEDKIRGIKENKYHGNLIFKSTNDKRCKMLANAILAFAIFISR